MDYKNFINKYGSAVILFLIIIFAFVQVPLFFMSIFTWVILFIMVYQLTNRWDVGLLLATAFLILLLIFRHLGHNEETLGKPLFLENFEGEGEGENEKPKGVVEGKDVEDNVPEVSPQEISKENILDKLTDNSVSNLVSMENDDILGGDSLENAQEDDLLNKIADEKTEDETDEDSSDSEEENEEVFAKGNKRRKPIGKTKKSKKTAYKAQKDLYNLVNTTKLLKSTLESMTPALSNGKKIMEKMQSLGMMDKL